MINDIKLSNRNVHLSLFVDDIAIWVETKHLNNGINILQQSLQNYYSASQQNRYKLYCIQYKCLRLCTGAFKSTPINILLITNKEKPLEIKRKELQRLSSYIGFITMIYFLIILIFTGKIIMRIKNLKITSIKISSKSRIN